MYRALSISLALIVVVTMGFACGSDDSGGGKVASGGTGTGATTSGGNGGSVTGGGGVAQGGSGGVVSGGGSGGVVSGGGTAGVTYGPYPAGPYGHNVGDTIADLQWEGYVNETGAQQSDTLPYVDYGTDAMRKSGKAYGLIHVSQFT